MPDATVISDTIPATMVAGQSYPVSVTMKNTGTMPGSEANLVRLAGVGDTAGDAFLFNQTRYTIAEGMTVGPNEEYTFSFIMTAPATTGTYHPEYRMVWELHEWFGEIVSRTVTVGASQG